MRNTTFEFETKSKTYKIQFEAFRFLYIFPVKLGNI